MIYDLAIDRLKFADVDDERRSHVLRQLGFEGIASLTKAVQIGQPVVRGADGMLYWGFVPSIAIVEAGLTGFEDGRPVLVPTDRLQKNEDDLPPARAKIVPWLQSRGNPLEDIEDMPLALGEILATMLGSHSEELHRAAQLLSGRKEPLHEDPTSEDTVEDVLQAYGLEVNEQNRKALLALVTEFLCKSDAGVGLIPSTVTASMPEGKETAEAVRHAFLQGLVYEVKLGGKHSVGTALAMDNRDPVFPRFWLLKPGSGRASPARGIRELMISQSRREAAFTHVARLFLPDDYPITDVLTLNDTEVAAIKVLGNGYAAAQKVPEDGRKLFAAARHDGRLYMWAALDYLLGNVDRHGGNVLIGPSGQVALIDHGSTLAGPNFDPTSDPATYVPYYLRAWVPEWKELDPKERRAKLPQAGPEQTEILRAFLRRFESEGMNVLHRYAPMAVPAVEARLQRLRAAQDPASELLNAWTLPPMTGEPTKDPNQLRETKTPESEKKTTTPDPHSVLAMYANLHNIHKVAEALNASYADVHQILTAAGATGQAQSTENQ